jgi:hypothetical protein
VEWRLRCAATPSGFQETRMKITLMMCIATATISCGKVMSSSTYDAASHDDAGVVDAASGCDPGAKFSPQAPLLKLAATFTSEGSPRLSADELTLYFHAISPTGNSDLYTASRSSTSELFDNPTSMMTLNTAASEMFPSISSSGFTLWFMSNRVANEGYHLYVATRHSLTENFGQPALASGINASLTTISDGDPFVASGDEELWFVSMRTPNYGSYDLWYDSLKSSSAMPTLAAELSSTFEEGSPMLSADRLTVYFSSRRTTTGAKGGMDIWRSHRSSAGDAFLSATLVTELTTAHDDYATWLSADNCRIYGASTDSGVPGLFMATRSP